VGTRTGGRCVRRHPRFFGLVQEQLLEFAEHSFALNKTNKQGASQRELLEQVAKSTGRTPKELIGPEFPDVSAHVWSAFMALHSGRTYGMSGPNPLTWEGIAAWCNLTGIVLSSWELETVKALDMAWVKAMNEDNG